MWKIYINFYNKILKIEKAQFFLSNNIYCIPKVKKTLLFGNIKENLEIKNLLIKMCYLQIILNSKSYVLFKKNKFNETKFQIQAGCKKLLNVRKSLLFIQYLVINIFPQLDLTKLSKYNKTKINFSYKFISKEIFKRILKTTNFSQTPQKIYVQIFCQNKNAKNFIFWRWLKLPTKF